MNSNYYDSGLNKYLQDISKIPILTPEEEKQLIIEYKNGNIQAKDKLIKANLRLVVSIAKRFKCNIPLTDLIEEGNLGLIHSIETFDYKMGRLSTYATNGITWCIKKAIGNQNDIIRIPIKIKNIIYKIDEYIERYQKIYGKKPTEEDISKELNIPVDKISEYLKIKYKNISLNKKIFEDNKHDEFQNFLVDEKTDVDREIVDEKIIVDENRDNLYKFLKRNLSKTELNIILLRYGFLDDKVRNYKEIAQILSITNHSARQLEYKAIKKLTKEKSKKKIKEIFTK